MSPSRARRLSARGIKLAVAGAIPLFAACAIHGGDPGEAADTTEQGLSACSFHIHSNTYSGPDYWGTIDFVNTGASALTNPTISFTVPGGVTCDYDPSGWKHTQSGATCTYSTTKSLSIAAGASYTFNYSTDSSSSWKAGSVEVTSASCGGGSATSSSSSGGTTSSTSTSSSTSASSSSSSGGTAACGCDGMSGCAVWENVYITWYGYNDNSCGSESQHGCNDIANPGLGPKKHSGATAGAGTYDDPSTAAASDTTDSGHVFEAAGGVTLKPGTMIYNPEVQQYFIMEDSCLECGDEYSCKLSSDDTDDPKPPAGCQAGKNLHIDFWMGPNTGSQPGSLQTCEDNATIGNPYAGTGVVIVNPPPNLPVKTGLLYPGGSSSTGGCFTSKQVDGDSCN
jgi:hypothetical protein